ncbi:hypothetical protein M513_09801, partial [Trichuris suis]
WGEVSVYARILERGLPRESTSFFTAHIFPILNLSSRKYTVRFIRACSPQNTTRFRYACGAGSPCLNVST